VEKIVERIQVKEIPVVETEERIKEIVREVPVEVVKEVPVYIKVKDDVNFTVLALRKDLTVQN
jgi:hypothetical protein